MSNKFQDHIISTCYCFSGRDIRVIVGHDGISYWLDHTSSQPHLQGGPEANDRLSAILGDESARRKVANVESEYTIAVPVPEAGLEMLRDQFAPYYWDESLPVDFDLDDGIDSVLEPLFWEHVNPYLNPPCTKE